MTSETQAVDELVKQSVLLPGEVDTLAHCAHSSKVERGQISQALDDFDSAIAPSVAEDERALRVAQLQFALGEHSAASASAKKIKNGGAWFILGRIQFQARKYTAAGDYFKKAVEAMGDQPEPLVGYAEALVGQGKTDEAADVMKQFCSSFSGTADSAYLQGRIEDMAGNYEAAIEQFEAALAIDDQHAEANFRLGYLYDLRGDDERAIEYYCKVAEDGRNYTGAVLNLGLLYEDNGRMEDAICCFRNVVRMQPGNWRAMLFLTDSLEASDMYYDEAEKQDSERMVQILKTPVSDFELSVRSRNCLAKMNIRNLGDLIRKSETEMLAYKNFGETSLREIKEMLNSKGLHLGMAREEDARRQHLDPPWPVAAKQGAPENAELAKPITDLELSVRSRKCMARLGIATISELLEKSEPELVSVKNFGQTSLQELKNRLTEMGLSLRQVNE